MNIKATHIWCKGCGKFTVLEVNNGDLMCSDCKLVIASIKVNNEDQ